jgi:hypothetical protein
VTKQKAPAPASNVVNLMDALKKSLAAEKTVAKAPAGKAKKAKQEDLRRQPQFKFPIEGGKTKTSKVAAMSSAGAKGRAKRKSA